MNYLTKKELIDEIDLTLLRADINQKDFVILNSLKYLLESVNSKCVDEWNYSEGKE